LGSTTAAPSNHSPAIYPRSFSTAAGEADVYLRDLPARKLADFFHEKGLVALKIEDQRQQWYDDWLHYQAEHFIYATVLSPREYSTRGGEFDMLRYARLLEVFGYFSPSHGYSLQVTFLGLFSILMGSNVRLKKEAVAAVEGGALLAFGVSEREHGSDLLANEFTLREIEPAHFLASGSKCYIGNSNVAAIVSVLAGKSNAEQRLRRMPPVLFALRPGPTSGIRTMRKIHTLGVRAAYVGEFAVSDHPVGSDDIIAEGRDAWDAVLGTVTLGKFFLAFGSIGICERAFEEATDHLRRRILYGKPVLDMPHIRALMSQAYARLLAMKLYSYRALDYVHSACAADRRYLLFCAVQKAKVSTQGVRVMSLLSECAGARGFDADTYLEMALRDAQLIPLLESSAHINLMSAVQFVARYFQRFDNTLKDPGSLTAGEAASTENAYLTQARSGAIDTVAFPSALKAYRATRHIRNVRLFVRQISAFRRVLRAVAADRADTQLSLAIGECLATIVYGQLIAENAQRLHVGDSLISVVFGLLVHDLNAAGLALASLPQLQKVDLALVMRLVRLPHTTQGEWDAVSALLTGR
jgi:acyl-CoA dehydrogenase